MAQQIPSLTKAEMAHLRGKAHHLKPIVAVGQSGITDGIVAAVAQALLDHELIKVRLYRPEDKQQAAQELALRTDAQVCGVIGHTVILYKKHPEKPRFTLTKDGDA
jgi:RNA-binding protein